MNTVFFYTIWRFYFFVFVEAIFIKKIKSSSFLVFFYIFFFIPKGTKYFSNAKTPNYFVLFIQYKKKHFFMMLQNNNTRIKICFTVFKEKHPMIK